LAYSVTLLLLSLTRRQTLTGNFTPWTISPSRSEEQGRPENGQQ